MTTSTTGDVPDTGKGTGDEPLATGHKLRQCLRCRATFHSEWAGERICAPCKSTSAWRNGALSRVHPMGR